MKTLVCLLSLFLVHDALAEKEPADLTKLRQTWENSLTEATKKVNKLYLKELEEMKKGLLPMDFELIGPWITDICYHNTSSYFEFPQTSIQQSH